MMCYHYEYHVHGDAPIWHTHYKATYLLEEYRNMHAFPENGVKVEQFTCSAG